jgi:MatE
MYVPPPEPQKTLARDLNATPPKVFGYLFSEDVSVVRLVAQVMPLVASFQVADGLAGSCGGVLRGLGRQHLGAAFNIVAYYILALPLGITLAFRAGYGLQGLWIGAFPSTQSQADAWLIVAPVCRQMLLLCRPGGGVVYRGNMRVPCCVARNGLGL